MAGIRSARLSRMWSTRDSPEQMLVEQKAAEAEPQIGGNFQKQQWRMPNAPQVCQVTVPKKYEANANPRFIPEDGEQKDRHARPLAREVERPGAHQRQGQPEEAGPEGDFLRIGAFHLLERVVDGHPQS